MTGAKRIGPKSLKDISPLILEQLNEGQIESVNLTEWLAVDHEQLIRSVLPIAYHDACLTEIRELKSKSAMQMIKIIGQTLFVETKKQKDKQLFDKLKDHTSDSVRCWAAYIVGSDDTMSLDTKFQEIKPFAADTHFGVREIAWMAVREDITNSLNEAIITLAGWAMDEDPNIRRFASESIRPNGVWCRQIQQLKETPQLALPILEQLKTDNSRYVQDSVANWLNDASKTQPQFVIDTCEQWSKNSPSATTKYIIKKALRTISKK